MQEIVAKSKFRNMVASGKCPLGTFISSIDPSTTEIMAEAGFDFVVIDSEHGKNDRTQVENHVRAANASGILPFVRVLENSPYVIQSFLDVGVQGVVVPHVDSAADAQRAVEASRYAPRGRRGMCPSCYAGAYNFARWAEHVARSDENVLVIPILESRAAVENIDEILAVDGIEVVLFGPGDLSADMGLNLLVDSDKLVSQWHRVRDAARAANKLVIAPSGFCSDDADALMAETDYMLLLRIGRQVFEDHSRKSR